MRGKVWQITRAGLFLFFVVLLAAMGPLSATGSAQRSMPAETKEHKHSEHRDAEKLRERLHGTTEQRRDTARGRGNPLPRALQPAAGFPEPGHAVLPADASKPHHSYVKFRHSPAVLQVFRH